MRSGILRDVATFQKRPATKDGYGQTSGAYANVAALVNVPVAIEDLFGSELYRAQALVANATTRFTMRGYPGWRADIGPTSRILADGRIFDVKSALNPDGINKELTILAVELVN
jgi:SPP1 family predicted phage head-tail adaptor